MDQRNGTVLICGDGVAASCCQWLLSRGGLPVNVQLVHRPRVPAVMLTETTQKLLSDVFEQENLFDGLPRIRKRVVAWGTASSKPLTLPHSAVVVSEDELFRRIQRFSTRGAFNLERPAEWTIYTSGPLPVASVAHEFGSRVATASAVKLRPGCDHEACWIESLEKGWLFLLPSSVESGCLLSVGAPVDELLSESHLIAGQVAEATAIAGSFPSHPRIADPLGEPGWIACGTAALRFDPLCGDGTGNAIREAILASAVVRAAQSELDVSRLVGHYRAKLLAGFHRHLEHCQQFYAAGNSGAWWDAELQSVERGLEWSARQSREAMPGKFRLNGFTLERLG